MFALSHAGEVIRSVILLALLFGVMIWWGVHCLKRSDDPARLIFKWILTVPALVGVVFLGRYLDRVIGGGLDYGAAFMGGIGALVLGIYLAIIWR